MTRHVRPIPPEVLEQIFADDPLPSPDSPPSWLVIALAWVAGMILIVALWTGNLFDGAA